MKNLLIYHPGTGTVISLRDAVYLVNVDNLDDQTLEELEAGIQVAPQYHKGYMLDNYNMTNLFFGV
jgi:hypothetical protein